MINEIICGGVKLDCTAVTEWVKSHPGSTKEAVLDSMPFKVLVQEYAEKIKHKGDISQKDFVRFADVVLGELNHLCNLKFNFGVWGL